MIASLPMYDWPEVRAATDEFWAVLQRHMPDLPALDRRAHYTDTWRDPSLLFSQTCGYPFTHEFHGRLAYVATPHYGVDGCQGPNYCSFAFAREDQPLESLRGGRAAINNPDSMSGMLAMKLLFAPLARDGLFFGTVVETGSHVKSMEAVRDGRADVCTIDAVCVALARRYRPDLLRGLVEIARSPMVPGLPYVTRVGDVVELRAGLRRDFDDPVSETARKALFLTGFTVLPPSAYTRILDLEKRMEAAGGLALL